jgi:hypothetical protein
MNCHVNDALEKIKDAEYGAPYIIIMYPDVDRLRELYSNYVHKQTKQNNFIVLINPFISLLIMLDRYFLKIE